MSDRSDVDEAIRTWAPKRHEVDEVTAERLAAVTRVVVSDAVPRHPTEAKLACGHVFRFLVWRESGEGRSLDATSVFAYIDDLERPESTRQPVEIALRHCIPEGATFGSPAPTRLQSGLATGVPRSSPRRSAAASGPRPRAAARSRRAELTPAEDPSRVEAVVANYSPEPKRIRAGLWAEIAEVCRDAVRASGPRRSGHATSRLAPTSLYVAWATVEGDQAVFTPESVTRFLELGRSAWTKSTYDAYSSSLRIVAKATLPELWPVDTVSMEPEWVGCSDQDLEAILTSIGGRTPTPRRQLQASVLLARGAGVIGLASALVRPSDISEFDGQVTVHVRTGRAPRVVPVINELGPALRRIAEKTSEEGGVHLLGGKRASVALANRPSALWNDHAELTGVIGEPALMRNAWLVWLITQPLPLRTMLERAGLQRTGAFDTLLELDAVDSDPAFLTRIALLI